jgi:hypothetical protein
VLKDCCIRLVSCGISNDMLRESVMEEYFQLDDLYICKNVNLRSNKVKTLNGWSAITVE